MKSRGGWGSSGLFNEEDVGESLYGRKASSRERPLTGFIVMFLTWLNVEMCIESRRNFYIYIYIK